MPKQQNKDTVEYLKSKIESAKSITFTEYLGLSADQLNELRQSMKDEGAELVVSKNTLLKVALEQNNSYTPKLDTDLKGSTATIFSYDDPLALFKPLSEFTKKFELPKIKSALIEGVYTSSEKVEEISMLPSREELLARVLSGMNAPVSGFVNALSGVQRNFVYVLNAIADTKSAEIK